MHDVALGAGQAHVFQTRSSSLRTRVKNVVTRAATGAPSHALREKGLCNTLEGDCHPGRPNAMDGKEFTRGEGRLSEPDM
jgi:hypothetical protein